MNAKSLTHSKDMPSCQTLIPYALCGGISEELTYLRWAFCSDLEVLHIVTINAVQQHRNCH